MGVGVAEGGERESEREREGKESVRGRGTDRWREGGGEEERGKKRDANLSEESSASSSIGTHLTVSIGKQLVSTRRDKRAPIDDTHFHSILCIFLLNLN